LPTKLSSRSEPPLADALLDKRVEEREQNKIFAPAF
jgi:hypothetical protein